LTITQTSALTGLAPGVPPITITGTVRNDADEAVSVRIITVSILVVRTAPHAPHGSCNESDYRIVNGTMLVDLQIPPHVTIEFGGAVIGLINKAVNQDACQGSIVKLDYESAP
jgi:hypothetical protein